MGWYAEFIHNVSDYTKTVVVTITRTVSTVPTAL